jgi:DNA-binding HxlR family transcriptional regulator
MKNERTKEFERAMGIKSTMLRKRVKVIDRTNSCERVNTSERTIGAERTKTTDSFTVDRVSHVG